MGWFLFHVYHVIAVFSILVHKIVSYIYDYFSLHTYMYFFLWFAPLNCYLYLWLFFLACIYIIFPSFAPFLLKANFYLHFYQMSQLTTAFLPLSFAWFGCIVKFIQEETEQTSTNTFLAEVGVILLQTSTNNAGVFLILASTTNWHLVIHLCFLVL